jgi:hypothetical protein
VQGFVWSHYECYPTLINEGRSIFLFTLGAVFKDTKPQFQSLCFETEILTPKWNKAGDLQVDVVKNHTAQQ